MLRNQITRACHHGREVSGDLTVIHADHLNALIGHLDGPQYWADL